MKKKKRRHRADHSDDLARLGSIFAELGFRGMTPPPPPEDHRPPPPPKGPCGKSVYQSLEKVRQAIKKLRNGKGDTAYLRPFPCEKCHGWHMTSVKSFRKP